MITEELITYFIAVSKRFASYNVRESLVTRVGNYCSSLRRFLLDAIGSIGLLLKTTI